MVLVANSNMGVEPLNNSGRHPSERFSVLFMPHSHPTALTACTHPEAFVKGQSFIFGYGTRIPLTGPTSTSVVAGGGGGETPQPPMLTVNSLAFSCRCASHPRKDLGILLVLPFLATL